MKSSTKKNLIFVGLAVLLIFPALEAVARMGGGHGSHGGGSSSGGHHMEGHIGEGAQTGRHHEYKDMNRHMRQGMHPDMAESMVHQYMKGRTSEPYEMGELKDGGSHFTTEIKRPDGSVRERLRID